MQLNSHAHLLQCEQQLEAQPIQTAFRVHQECSASKELALRLIAHLARIAQLHLGLLALARAELTRLVEFVSHAHQVIIVSLVDLLDSNVRQVLTQQALELNLLLIVN